MRGEFIGVWSETWREIWLPLIDHEGVPEDIFCELYRALVRRIATARSHRPESRNRQMARPRNYLIRKRLLDSAITTDRSLVAIPKQCRCSQAPHLATTPAIDLVFGRNVKQPRPLF